MLNYPTGGDLEYGNIYWDANAVAQTIETADTPIACRNTTAGLFNAWTRVAGSTGAITAFSDATPNVSAACVGHGLVTGDIVSIRGTTNYNGVFEITRVDDNNFTFVDTWVANDGASDWDSPDYLLAGVGTNGTYMINWNVSASVGGAAGDEVLFGIYKNVTLHPCSRSSWKFDNNDVSSVGGQGFVTVSEDDRVFMTVQSDDTDAVTLKYGCLSIHRL